MIDPRRVRRSTAAVLVLIAAALATGCAPAAPVDNSKEVRSAIEAVNAKFSDLAGKKDAAGIAALYTEDARVLPPNGPPVEGRAAIEQFFGAILPGIARVQLDTVQVEARGDLAYEQEALGFFDANGTKIDDGKAIVVWKKVGDDWKLHRDMFSSNQPPPAAAPPADAAMPADGAAPEGATAPPPAGGAPPPPPPG